MNHLYSRVLLKFVLTAVGIVFVSALPALFNGIKPDIMSYGSMVLSLFSHLIHPDALIYSVGEKAVPLFPNIWGKWSYSITLLSVAFFIAFIVALICTYVTMLLPKKVRNKITFSLSLMESIPDLLVIGIFTIIVREIYRNTNIEFFAIVTMGDERIYVLPVIVLSLLPALLFYRIMILDFEEEMSKSYVDLAKNKGLNSRELLINHVLRNAMISIFLHSKSILWFMLSNLLLVEYVFNLAGLLRFMYEFYSPQVLAAGLLLIFVPIYIMQAAGQILIEKVTARQLEV